MNQKTAKVYFHELLGRIGTWFLLLSKKCFTVKSDTYRIIGYVLAAWHATCNRYIQRLARSEKKHKKKEQEIKKKLDKTQKKDVW